MICIAGSVVSHWQDPCLTATQLVGHAQFFFLLCRDGRTWRPVPSFKSPHCMCAWSFQTHAIDNNETWNMPLRDGNSNMTKTWQKPPTSDWFIFPSSQHPLYSPSRFHIASAFKPLVFSQPFLKLWNLLRVMLGKPGVDGVTEGVSKLRNDVGVSVLHSKLLKPAVERTWWCLRLNPTKSLSFCPMLYYRSSWTADSDHACQLDYQPKTHRIIMTFWIPQPVHEPTILSGYRQLNILDSMENSNKSAILGDHETLKLMILTWLHRTSTISCWFTSQYLIILHNNNEFWFPRDQFGSKNTPIVGWLWMANSTWMVLLGTTMATVGQCWSPWSSWKMRKLGWHREAAPRACPNG